MSKIFLKKRKEEPVLRFHPWVFSGAIRNIEGDVANGDIVEIYSAKGQFLAKGHYNDGSIAVRLFAFEDVDINQDFWNTKLQKAFAYRKRLGLIDSDSTNCYRLIHAEGDGLPGLIIDIYHQTAVVQCHSIGMHRQREELAKALQATYGDKLQTIYNKSVETLPRVYAQAFENGYLLGSDETNVVLENKHQFNINWVTGQKTGFFLDQRDNRQLLSEYVQDKVVLNAFCYSGGFSIYALQAGAKEVHSIDISAKAMELTDQNVALNAPFTGKHTSITADVMQFLKENKNNYEVIVLDPPAFAKNLKKRHNAVQAYKRLNKLALEQIAPGGILLTFSCSQVVGKELFYNTIVAAAIEAGRKVRVMKHLSQAADHPVSLFHPEGAYLKGLVIYVE